MIRALQDLGCGDAIEGPPPSGLFRFASVWAPVERGIYFVEGSGRNGPDIGLIRDEPSIVLTSMRGRHHDVSWVVVEDPQRCFYRLMALLVPEPPGRGTHPTAVVIDSDVAESAEIGPFCVVRGATIGEGARLVAHASVLERSVIGPRVVIEPNTTIGATGAAWVWDEGGEARIRQPQIGGVEIGEDAFIGAGSTIVRGSTSDVTRIGPGSVLAPGNCLGHGCDVGRNVHLANNVTLGGNVTLGDRAFVGSGAVVRPRIRVAPDTVIGAGAVVVRDIESPGGTWVGSPAGPIGSAFRSRAGVPLSGRTPG